MVTRMVAECHRERREMLRNCTLGLGFMLLRWCPGQGSNLHDGITRRGILSPLCLPVSPPGRKAWIVSERNWRRVRASPIGGGGRNRTGVHGFAGRKCIEAQQGVTERFSKKQGVVIFDDI